jgi:hypothetical protein
LYCLKNSKIFFPCNKVAFLRIWKTNSLILNGVFLVKQEEKVKYLGIIILVLMAFSMIAGIAISVINNPIQPDNTNNDLPDPTATTFNYSLSFDANAIKDLSSFRTALVTSFDDKLLIDAELKKVSGVSTVSSIIRKDDATAINWTYLAEVTIKKTANINEVLNGIYLVKYFDANADKLAMKHMTINVPKSVMLHNTDLNIDRNYSFTSTTLSALTQISTMPSDELTVEGTIQIQGSAIVSIELIESANKTAQSRMIEEWEAQMIDQNGQLIIDTTNTSVDTNQ